MQATTTPPPNLTPEQQAQVSFAEHALAAGLVDVPDGTDPWNVLDVLVEQLTGRPADELTEGDWIRLAASMAAGPVVIGFPGPRSRRSTRPPKPIGFADGEPHPCGDYGGRTVRGRPCRLEGRHGCGLCRYHGDRCCAGVRGPRHDCPRCECRRCHFCRCSLP